MSAVISQKQGRKRICCLSFAPALAQICDGDTEGKLYLCIEMNGHRRGRNG